MHTARSTMKRQLECSFLAVTTLLVSRVQTPTHPHSTPARAVFSKLKRDPSPTREGKEEWGKEVSPMLSSLTNGGVGCSLALMAEPPQGREYSSCDVLLIESVQESPGRAVGSLHMEPVTISSMHLLVDRALHPKSSSTLQLASSLNSKCHLLRDVLSTPQSRLAPTCQTFLFFIISLFSF